MKAMKYLILASLMLVLSSCVDQEDGEYIPGIDGPHVNIQDGKILITVELININLDTVLTVSNPKLPSSLISLSQGEKGGTQIQASFDLKDVESEEFKVVPPELLPDGRPFPFMIDGTLPAIAMHIPKAKNMTFYASEKLFGFFLPLKLPFEFQDDVNYRIRINGENYGIVALIHPDEQGLGSGVVALLTLDEVRDNPELQKLLRLSKKYKNHLF
jgi:hypothetical protein